MKLKKPSATPLAFGQNLPKPDFYRQVAIITEKHTGTEQVIIFWDLNALAAAKSMRMELPFGTVCVCTICQIYVTGG